MNWTRKHWGKVAVALLVALLLLVIVVGEVRSCPPTPTPGEPPDDPPDDPPSYPTPLPPPTPTVMVILLPETGGDLTMWPVLIVLAIVTLIVVDLYNTWNATHEERSE